jgi:hypothetical protein
MVTTLLSLAKLLAKLSSFFNIGTEFPDLFRELEEIEKEEKEKIEGRVEEGKGGKNEGRTQQQQQQQQPPPLGPATPVGGDDLMSFLTNIYSSNVRSSPTTTTTTTKPPSSSSSSSFSSSSLVTIPQKLAFLFSYLSSLYQRHIDVSVQDVACELYSVLSLRYV